MRKLIAINVLIVSLLGLSIFGLTRFIVQNWDVISLKRERPELVEAMQKVVDEEVKELQLAEQKVKDNSVKKILSPLVTDEEMEVLKEVK